MAQDREDADGREIVRLKAILDRARPASEEALANLARWYDVQLTYSSNAIEGNTLTLSETKIVVEDGITIGGKPLKDHMEAIDLFEATRAIRDIARRGSPVGEGDVLRLHAMVLHRSGPKFAGRYADHQRRVTGSNVVFPRADKIPGLMDAFGRKLQQASGWPDAFEAHYDLVSIHPFVDGNGRTARLLMNLLLLRDGYPPVAIGPSERSDYLDTIGNRQLAEPLGHGIVDRDSRSRYRAFLCRRLSASLADHLDHLGIAPSADDA